MRTNIKKLLKRISFRTLITISFFSFSHTNIKEPYLHVPNHLGILDKRSLDSISEKGIQLGRLLFYEKKLSGNNKLSCSSCHIQKFAFSDSLRFSLGFNGATPRNSMSLTNLLWQSKFFWDGRVSRLQHQALFPIQNANEMNQDLSELENELIVYKQNFYEVYGSYEISTSKIADALSQFEKSLISSNSRYDKFIQGDSNIFNKYELNGYKLFNSIPFPNSNIRGANCVSCHSGPLLTSPAFHNNGLDSIFNDLGVGNATGNNYEKGQFKVPSLRNIAITAPYMHDGRFATLDEVLNHYNEHVKNSPTISPMFFGVSNDINSSRLNLTKNEIMDLICFLKTFTDSNFVTNKKYSSPF